MTTLAFDGTSVALVRQEKRDTFFVVVLCYQRGGMFHVGLMVC